MGYRNREERIPPVSPFGIGAEQLLGMGELGASSPAEQAVDGQIALTLWTKSRKASSRESPVFSMTQGTICLLRVL